MPIAFILLISLLSAALTGCATGPKYSDTTPAQIESGKALVYIYRKSSMVGAAGQPSIYANGELLTKVKNGGYYPYQTAPGTIIFAKQSGVTPILIGMWALTEMIEKQREALRIEAQAGRTYYVQCDQGGRMKLVDDAIGREAILKCKLLPKAE